MNDLSLTAVNDSENTLQLKRMPGNGNRLLVTAKFSVGAERKVFLSDERIAFLKTIKVGEKIPVRQRGSLQFIELCYASNVPNTLVFVFYFRPDKKAVQHVMNTIHDGIISVSCEPFFAAVELLKTGTVQS